MKRIAYLLLPLLFTWSCNQKVKKSSGDFTIRTGVNVSHWLSQSIKRGEERKNYITKADFDTIAAMHFDHVRIPFDEVQLWDSLGNKEPEAFGLLHNAIHWAIGAKLRVIVDLHIIRSHYFNAKVKPLWTDPKEQQKLIDMWMQLSDELNQYPTDSLAYEILNEAVADNPDDWNNLLARVVKAIREKEPVRKIVIGSNRWQSAETFPQLKLPENDTNFILSFHFYSPFLLTHHEAPWTSIARYDGPVNYPGLLVDTTSLKGYDAETVKEVEMQDGYYNKDTLYRQMLPAIETAKKYNLPLYCGEYGAYPTTPESIRFRWYKDVTAIFNENNIAYCHWCYKGDFPVVGENSAPNWPLVNILTAK